MRRHPHPPDLAAGIVAKAKPGAPVIETNNCYPQQREGRIDAIEESWCQQPGTRVYGKDYDVEKRPADFRA